MRPQNGEVGEGRGTENNEEERCLKRRKLLNEDIEDGQVENEWCTKGEDMELDASDEEFLPKSLEMRKMSKNTETPLEKYTERDQQEDAAAMRALGLPTSFLSTKGKHVPGNNIYVAYKVHIRKVNQVVSKKGRPRGGGPMSKAIPKPS